MCCVGVLDGPSGGAGSARGSPPPPTPPQDVQSRLLPCLHPTPNKPSRAEPSASTQALPQSPWKRWEQRAKRTPGTSVQDGELTRQRPCGDGV